MAAKAGVPFARAGAAASAAAFCCCSLIFLLHAHSCKIRSLMNVSELSGNCNNFLSRPGQFSATHARHKARCCWSKARFLTDVER